MNAIAFTSLGHGVYAIDGHCRKTAPNWLVRSTAPVNRGETAVPYALIFCAMRIALADRQDRNCRCHGIRNETLLVSLVVEPVDIGLGWLFCAAEGYLWMEINSGDGELAIDIFSQVADRVVVVTVNDKTAARRHRQES